MTAVVTGVYQLKLWLAVMETTHLGGKLILICYQAQLLLSAPEKHSFRLLH